MIVPKIVGLRKIHHMNCARILGIKLPCNRIGQQTACLKIVTGMSLRGCLFINISTKEIPTKMCVSLISIPCISSDLSVFHPRNLPHWRWWYGTLLDISASLKIESVICEIYKSFQTNLDWNIHLCSIGKGSASTGRFPGSTLAFLQGV